MKAPVLAATLLVLAASHSLSQIRLVDSGTSAYVIHRDQAAPQSVKEAAEELQRVIRHSTGVKLSIVTEPAEKMISVGDTAASRAAGIKADAIPIEGFVIETKGPNIFIVGKDTGDNETTPGGGASDGTYYGSLDFLERFVGARWLTPLENGEDIPSNSLLEIPETKLADAPDFPNRVGQRYWVGNGQVNDAWLRRMRMAEYRLPVKIDSVHAWHLYGIPQKLRGHPEYMALLNGQRVRIEDVKSPHLQEAKFCTTNPGLIALVADSVLEASQKEPGRKMWSIAPSDGGGWCECEKCQALDERTDPKQWPGNKMYGNISYTRRMLTFYNEVARRVKERAPDLILGGYAYGIYTYPPDQPMEMEPNVYITLASRPYYGYQLYHPVLQDEFYRLTSAWNDMLPGRMGWFDYSTWVGLNRISVGAPYPPGQAILQTIFPQMKKLQWEGMFWDTHQIQGYGALYAYLVAKLMWDADADVYALTREWMKRAYGKGAAVPMEKLYTLLEDSLARYKQSKTYDNQYRCVPEQVRDIHLPIFGQMEELYKEALAQEMTPVQRERLEMFGANLVLLHWNMRKAGWLPEPEKSIFYRTDEQFAEFAHAMRASPAINRNPIDPKTLLVPQLGLEGAKPDSMHE